MLFQIVQRYSQKKFLFGEENKKNIFAENFINVNKH